MNTTVDLADFLLVQRWKAFRTLEGAGPAILHISHYGGGGTERHVRELSGLLEAEGVRSLVLRPSYIPKGKYILERYQCPNHNPLTYYQDLSWNLLLQDIQKLNVQHLHVHHLWGHTQPIYPFLKQSRIPYDITIHDYYFACPRIHMIHDQSQYCGEPDEAGCNACIKKRGHLSPEFPQDITIETWRNVHRELSEGARKIFVPDVSVQERFQRYFPNREYCIRPHFNTTHSARPIAARWLPDQPIHVVVLGNVIPGKGPEIVLQCAQDALERKLPLVFKVVGIFEPLPDPLPTNVTVTGPYEDANLFSLMEQAQPHVALFPSTVPETYCYTLSAALAGGLYCFGVDLGAIGRRLQNTDRGETFAFGTSAHAINDRLLALAGRSSTTSAPDELWCGKYSNILSDYYELPPSIR